MKTGLDETLNEPWLIDSPQYSNPTLPPHLASNDKNCSEQPLDVLARDKKSGKPGMHGVPEKIFFGYENINRGSVCLR